MGDRTDELLRRRQADLQAGADGVVADLGRLDGGVRTPEDCDRWRITHGQ